MAKEAAKPSSGGGGKQKKKKWSKGKVKDKANNAVLLDKETLGKILKEVPQYKVITPSVLVDRLKINGSLARLSLRELYKQGKIKLVASHHAQLIYTRTTAAAEEAKEAEEKPKEEKVEKGKKEPKAKGKKAEEISKSDSIQTGVVINTTGLFAKLLGMIFKELAEILSREDFVVQKAQGQLAEVNVIRKPWGPALCITPWNAPAPLEAHKIAAGLAAGCPVILKPSEFSHASAQAIAQAFLESCDPVNATDNPTDIFPIGTFQILHGDASVGAQLVNDYRIACVSFTGGLHGGRAISRACADTFRPIQLELGGNNACVVLEDADLDLVGPGILAGLTTNNGQWCRAVGRILVHKSLEEKVLNKVMDIFAKLKIGDALDPTTEMGPIAHYGHLRLLKKSIDALIAKGGKVHSTTPLPTLGGNFLPPIVITGCKPEDTLDEMFGPVAVLHTFNDEKEALFLANQTPFGLSGYVYGNEQRALEFAKKMRTGDVKVNGCKLLSLARTAPRPAWGLSGYGEEGGFETLNFFCGKTVVGVANRK